MRAIQSTHVAEIMDTGIHKAEGTVRSIIEIKPPILQLGPVFTEAVLGMQPPTDIKCGEIATTPTANILCAQASSQEDIEVIRSRIQCLANDLHEATDMLGQQPFGDAAVN